jgi:hypothetical protein
LPVAGCQCEQMFAVTANLREHPATERARELLFADVAEDAIVADAHAVDGLLQRVVGEVARIDFDFR